MRHGLVCVGFVVVCAGGIICMNEYPSCGTHGSSPPCFCGISTSYLDFCHECFDFICYFYLDSLCVHGVRAQIY